jgi:hypothetical protein
MAGKHGVAEAMTRGMRQRLVSMGRSGPVGAEIATALARGVLWRGRAAFRDRQMGTAARVAGFALALAAAGRRRRAPDASAPLSERREVP